MQIDPAALNVHPHVEHVLHTVQLLLPAGRLLGEHLKVGRDLDGVDAVRVVGHLLEELVPAANQPALALLEGDQVEDGLAPELGGVLEEGLERDLALRGHDDLAEHLRVALQIRVPDHAQRQLAEGPRGVQLTAQLTPVAIAQRRRAQLHDHRRRLAVALEHLLEVMEGLVLAHAVRECLQAVQHQLELRRQLLAVHGVPRRLLHLVDAAPHRTQHVPHLLQTGQLLAQRLQRFAGARTRARQTQRQLGLLYAIAVALQTLLSRGEHAQCLERVRVAQVAGHRLVTRPVGGQASHVLLDTLRFAGDLGLQNGNLRADRLLLARQHAAEHRPLALHHLQLEPVARKVVALLAQQSVAGTEAAHLLGPLVRACGQLLHADDDRDRVRCAARVHRLALERGAFARQQLHKVAHALAETRAERVQDVLVPVVVLVVDLGLHLVVADHHRAQTLLDLGGVHLVTGRLDLLQHLAPAVQVVAQAAVHRARLHVPQRLVLQPHVHVALCAGHQLADGRVRAHQLLFVHIGQQVSVRGIQCQVRDARRRRGGGGGGQVVARALQPGQIAHDAQPRAQLGAQDRVRLRQRREHLHHLAAHAQRVR
mmetsp:Transcript_3550/g.11019  ORF Transcript_3550/g.11019 Transcript_3550/m.11019 type:complete len:596 (+) Transcript_3550:9485-11272(+)